MENRAHAIIAVCFLIVFALVAVFIFFWLTSGPREPLSYRIVTTESVAGLAPQSDVEFKGLMVGHVQRIRFDPTDRARVIIDFSVQRDTYVTHATYAVLTTHGLIGNEVLELKLGKGSSAPLVTSVRDPARVPLRKGLIAGLEDSAQQDMQALHSALASVQALLDPDNRKHIAASIRQIDVVTARLAAIEAHLLPAARQVPALMESTRKSLAESRALLANANRLAEAARAPVQKAAGVEDTVRRLGNRLDRQTAPDIDALSQSLMRTSRLLEDLIRELKAKPQSLIFGPPQPPPGPGEPGFRPTHRKDGNHDR